MFALLESCLPFFKFSKKPTQPYSSAFFFFKLHSPVIFESHSWLLTSEEAERSVGAYEKKLPVLY